MLSSWLNANLTNIAAQYGITASRLQGLIENYLGAYTSGVAQGLQTGIAISAVGTVLAWFTFQSEGVR